MRHLMVSVSAGAVLALSATAVAAQSAPEERTATTSGTTLEEVVVTAQRREQAAQDVGIALSVLTGENLTQQGISNVNQIQNATPNLEVEPAFGGGAAQFRMRGVGFQDYASNNSPTVGVYVNEVAYPVPVMTQGLIFDVERVEILRGPQGTLYGRNTTGGAISFITRRPTETRTAGLMAEWGSHELWRAEGYISGALAEGLRGRLAVSTEQGGAWQRNRATGESLGDADRSGARALLAWDPSQNLSLLFDIHGGVDKSENLGLYLLSDLRTRNGLGPTIPADQDHSLTGWGMSPRFAASIGRDPTDKPGRDNSSWGASLNANLALSETMNLTSITSFENLDRSEYGDWDSSPSIEADTFFGSLVDVFSQELRLASNADGPLTWVTGFYYSKQDLNERYFSDFSHIYGTYAQVTYDQSVESWSLFGQAEYAFSDRLKAIVGLRYEEETRELQGFGSAFGGATALPPTTVDTEMTPLTGKAALEFTPSDNLLIYGSISRGAKSGGFTTYNTGNRSGIEPFMPEILWAYEVGFKANPTQTFQLNGAAYYYSYTDQQVLSAIWTTNGPVGRFTNVPESHIWGAELEAIMRPAEGLQIGQTLSYKKGEYDDYQTLDVAASRLAWAAVYADKSGDPILFPAWSYSGWISYDWMVSDFAVTAEANYSFRDEYLSWLGPKYDVDSYWLANASVTVGPETSNWAVTFWVRNLFDQEYDLTRNFFTSADIAQPGRPRTVGIRLSLHY